MFRRACRMKLRLGAGASGGAWKPLTQTGRKRPGGIRACPTGLPVKAYAPVCVQVSNIRLWPSPPFWSEATLRAAPRCKGDSMQKLGRWHWVLIGCVGLGLVGALADPPEKATTVASKVRIAHPEAKALRKDGFFALLIDRRFDPKALPDIARKLCDNRQHCNVTGWTDRATVARGYPFTDREAEAIAFSYSVNRANGNETVLWDCQIWPRQPQNSCLGK